MTYTKSYISIVSLISIFTFGIVALNVTSFAQTDNTKCFPEKEASEKTLTETAVNVVGTMFHVEDTLINFNPYYRVMGTTINTSFGCFNDLANKISGAGGSGSTVDAIRQQSCGGTEPAVCDSITNNYQTAEGGFNRSAFASGRTAGSLLGYANFMTNTVRYEPTPVNTAYFFKDYAAKIPVLGDSVYAQNTVTYGNTLIDNALVIWKVFRNIAYALMSVVMLWVGFAIITRKRISSQVVVNVQYALPKIVIALVMIAFSYPVGALITQLAWTLFQSADLIVKSIGGTGVITTGISVYQATGIGGLVLLAVGIIFWGAGGGALIGFLAIVALVVFGMYLFAWIKAFWMMVKMVISTVISPLQVALYALPGQDDQLGNWIKQMLAWGLGLFCMGMTIQLTQAFTWILLSQAYSFMSGSFASNAAPVSGSLYNIILAPLILVFGYATAIKVPNIIEDAVMNKKRR